MGRVLHKRPRCSRCTVLNYRIALDQYLSFLSKRDGIEYFDISFEMFSKNNIESYLQYLAKVKQLSAATRNARLAAISSFLRYAVAIDPKFLSNVIAVSTIKKAPIKQKINVDYLSENAVKALLNVPGQYTYIGRRDTMIIVLLYDTRLNYGYVRGVIPRIILENWHMYHFSKIGVCLKHRYHWHRY